MLALFEKAILICTVLGVTIASCISCSPALTVQRNIILNESEEAFKLWPSVVRLSTIPASQEDEGIYLATGWAIDENHLMTAGHFCNSATDLMTLGKAKKEINIDLSDHQGRPAGRVKGHIIAFVNKGLDDMCIIKSKGHGVIPLEIETDLSAVETEDRIITVGGPKGRWPIRREGFVWGVADDALLIAIEIQPGNSGGPIVWQGKVIGMIILSAGDVNEAGVAVLSTDLLEFISKHIK